MGRKSIVGDVINFRGLVYAPVNEMGVVALFAKVCEDMSFIIEEVRAEFPDCIARRKVSRGWERLAIEFEFRSSNFRRHGHDPKGCDLIVCWEHDWEDAEVSVLALKPYITDQRARLLSPLERVRISEPVEVRRTKLTSGGIKNGYLILRPLDDFWPEECFGGNTEPADKHLIVEFTGVGRISTDISGRHQTFRSAHSEVKRFVARHRLSPGDEIDIIRLAKREYRIRPTSKRKAK